MKKANATPIWIPNDLRIQTANITRFKHAVGLPNACFDELHRFSLEQPGAFWRAVWDFCKVPGDPGLVHLTQGKGILDWKWFPEGRLNFAEVMLKPHRLGDPAFAKATAVVARNELGQRVALTRKQLFDEVVRIASLLSDRGVTAGDRVAAIVPNRVEALIGMLATAALGAIWSSCSPEFGDDAICDRFGQIEPRVMISTTSAYYNGKHIDLTDKLSRVLGRLPTLETLVLFEGAFEKDDSAKGKVESLLNASPSPAVVVPWNDTAANAGAAMEFVRLPFDHPLCILYSSGTTGTPKCIVHGAGGTVLQHAKEHVLHCDLKPGDTLFYYTTTGWMMWNWLLSGLGAEATIVLYDGSPLAPDAKVLWELAEAENITHFGASPRYFSFVEKSGVVPNQIARLGALRCVMSTGSPLLSESFDWIYKNTRSDLNLASISGGTDILSCFVLGNPVLPVYAGQIQCKGLGMDVRIYNAGGEAVVGEPGELVCATPFPSMPIGFWNDPEDEKYRAAYFDRFDNVWCHGDWAEETEQGGFIIYGRSDATLNPSGVRIGTAEIYRQVEVFPQIAECLATVLRSEGDEQIVLFVKMASTNQLDEPLIAAIRKRLRERCSARHVPAYIASAPDLPRTISGKLSELAVRSAIGGQNLGNTGALANPECIDFFRAWKP
jgi:acetoacetyl-CoA synthetase